MGSQSQRRNDTAIILHQTAGNSLLTGQTHHKLVKRDFSVFIPQRFSLFFFFLAGRLYRGEFETLTMLILILVACLTLRGHEAGLLHA